MVILSSIDVSFDKIWREWKICFCSRGCSVTKVYPVLMLDLMKVGEGGIYGFVEEAVPSQKCIKAMHWILVEWSPTEMLPEGFII